MTGKFFKLTSLLFSLTGLFACKSNAQYAEAKDGKSLLWEVSGNGLNKPSYIFGTMHLLCASDAMLSDNLKSIIKNADEIYFEIDMDDLGEMFKGLQMGVMKNDTTLKDLYTEEEYERLQNFFKEHGMGLQFTMMRKMQPMLVSALVYQAVMPCSETEGMELSIMQVAKKSSKEIKGLETAAFQAALLNDIPYSTQAKELLMSIDSTSYALQESEKMMDLYREQDLDKLLQFSLESDGGTIAEVQDVMINKRNANWANQFPGIAKNKQLLIAVGAGNLGGDKGLLNLLKHSGYTVRAIENKSASGGRTPM